MKVLCIATLLTLVGTSVGLECYSCNSKVDSSCNDPFADSSPALIDAFLQTCPEKEGEGAPFCRKTKMWFEVNGETRVQRDCAYKRRENYDCYQQRADDHVVDVCQCDNDRCNGATSTYASTLSALAAVAALYFYRV